MRSVPSTLLVMVPVTVCPFDLVMRSVPLVPLSTLKARPVTTGVSGLSVSRTKARLTPVLTCAASLRPVALLVYLNCSVWLPLALGRLAPVKTRVVVPLPKTPLLQDDEASVVFQDRNLVLSRALERVTVMFWVPLLVIRSVPKTPVSSLKATPAMLGGDSSTAACNCATLLIVRSLNPDPSSVIWPAMVAMAAVGLVNLFKSSSWEMVSSSLPARLGVVLGLPSTLMVGMTAMSDISWPVVLSSRVLARALLMDMRSAEDIPVSTEPSVRPDLTAASSVRGLMLTILGMMPSVTTMARRSGVPVIAGLPRLNSVLVASSM